jgi:hypothetical protein
MGMRERAPDRNPVREVYRKGTWHRSLAVALVRLTYYGIVVLGESTVTLEQMRRGGLVLCG